LASAENPKDRNCPPFRRVPPTLFLLLPFSSLKSDPGGLFGSMVRRMAALPVPAG
jgi:hypothetical protein